MNWSDLRVFLAVARQGTLSAAARVLKVDQSTVGRRLLALEESLGARLVERTPSGYVLTAAGEGVKQSAERIEAEAAELERRVSGRDVRLDGLVRVTAAGCFGNQFIAPLLADFRRIHPGIDLELITDDRLFSLSMREAELAIRMTPPDGNELFVRRLAAMRYALYANSDYLTRYGAPNFTNGLSGHEVIEYLAEIDVVEMRWSREVAPAAYRSVRSNSLQAQLSMTLAGAGIGVLPCYLGDAERRLMRLTDPVTGPERGIWVAVHRDLRQVPRIRVVMDFLAWNIKRLQWALQGTAALAEDEKFV